MSPRARPDLDRRSARHDSTWPTSRLPRCAEVQTIRWSVGLKLQVDGESDAFVSAGNTGAQMAASALLLGSHAGLTRPRDRDDLSHRSKADRRSRLRRERRLLSERARPVRLARRGLCRVRARAEQACGRLAQHRRRAGERKRTSQGGIRSCFRSAGFNFHGNVEGRDLPAGASDRGPIDVVVCDGFVGNVVLKFYEAVMPMIVGLVERHSCNRQRKARSRARELSIRLPTAALRCSESAASASSVTVTRRRAPSRMRSRLQCAL